MNPSPTAPRSEPVDGLLSEPHRRSILDAGTTTEIPLRLSAADFDAFTAGGITLLVA